MPNIVRISAIQPDGLQKFKNISLKKYTPETIEKMSEEWKAHVREGKANEFVNPPPDAKKKQSDDSSSESSIEEKHSNSYFEDFEIDDLEFPNNGGVSFAFIGSTRSGKSTAMTYVWEKFFKKHISILMTYSAHTQVYKKLNTKNTIVADDYYAPIVDDCMRINRETDNKYPFLLIFDDLAMSGKNDEKMTRLLCVGRNAGCSVLLCGQRLQMLSATGRSNINYICCFRQNTDSATKDTVETYLRSYMPDTMSISEMCKVYRQLTADHHFLLIDTFNDKVYRCKCRI
jgi:hypothetical protein